MSKRRLEYLGALLVSVWFAAGCGSSSGGGAAGSGEVTSLSGSRALNSLSAAEAAKLCTDSGSYASAAVSQANACKFAAVFSASFSAPTTDAEARAACMAIYTPCLSAPAQTNDTCDAIPATCTATVAQYSACMKDSIAAFNQTLAVLPGCSTLKLSDLSDNSGGGAGTAGGAAATEASCVTLEKACPGFSVPSGP